ncbi:MAG: GGGtGRT protein [Clostridia bacterium]
MEKFEFGPRQEGISICMKKHGFSSFSECIETCQGLGLDIGKMVRDIQPIAFENAVQAFTLGSAIAIKNNLTNPNDIANALGEGLQAFCIKGSVADQRQIGVGHGRLASMLLDEKNTCFCFLAGHESFAAAEGALGIANSANKIRKTPLKVILNGLGKDAAYIIARINGFTYVKTNFDQKENKLNILETKAFSNDKKASVLVYGAYDVSEGVAIMEHEKVNISITGNSTNPVRFQHPVAGIFKKVQTEKGIPYFSVASGGGTGRTLHPDNVAAGPASYGLTDTMGRMHSDAQFAGSSSVPAHVEMMGFIGMGNNPLVGACVSITVSLALAIKNHK